MKTKHTLSILLITLIFIYERGNAQAPSWAWAKSVGGAQSEGGYKTATDASGNVLLTGSFNSTSITFGTTTLTNAGSTTTSDLFIVKYDAPGNVLWAKSVGGSGSDVGFGIAADASGNILVTGAFKSPSITFGTITLINSNNYDDIFVVKYDTSGNVLWAKSAGGNDYDYSVDICTDTSENVFVTGFFNSPSITFGTTTLTNAGTEDIFTVKYDALGNILWATSAGGVSFDEGAAISADINGNVVITGYFQSPSITFGGTVLTNSDITGSPDIFVVKYDTSGNVLWAVSAVGSYYDLGHDILNDGSGNVIITGYFESPSLDFGTTTLYNTLPPGDVFVAKYDASGNFLWAKSAGGASPDYGNGIATDASGNMLVAGSFNSYSITFGTTTLTNAGSTTTSDLFIVKYDTSGNVMWAKSVGGTGSDGGFGIATDASGNVLITGSFASPSINFGATTLTNAGSDDIFIAKLDGTTGIPDASTSLSMTSVFPNPANDYLTINTGINKKQVITITDITGKIIYSITTLADKTIINTKDFLQGVYAVQVQAGDGVETRKVVVTR